MPTTGSGSSQALIAQLTDRLRPHHPCLDAGAGSGMITVPLARAGIGITALDRSPAMLARIEERTAGIASLAIVPGDIAALPFADEAFGSVLVAYVFHLIAACEQAVGELVRVLDRGGILLVNLGGAGDMPPDLARLTQHFLAQLGAPRESSRPVIGPASAEEFDATVRSHGLAPVTPVMVAYDDVLTPERVIRRLEHNVFARPGMAEDAQAAASASHDWACTTFGSLDRPFPRTQRIVFRAYTR